MVLTVILPVRLFSFSKSFETILFRLCRLNVSPLMALVLWWGSSLHAARPLRLHLGRRLISSIQVRREVLCLRILCRSDARPLTSTCSAVAERPKSIVVYWYRPVITRGTQEHPPGGTDRAVFSPMDNLWANTAHVDGYVVNSYICVLFRPTRFVITGTLMPLYLHPCRILWPSHFWHFPFSTQYVAPKSQTGEHRD